MITQCQVCGKTFKAKKSTAKYCSVRCSAIAHSQKMRGENNPRWKEKVVSLCKICGKPFEHKPSKNQKYCSVECKNIAHSRKMKGVGNSNWKGGKIAKLCKFCGKIMYVKRCRSEVVKFCSKSCRAKWMLTHTKSYDRWRMQVYVRDYFTCALCNQVGGHLVAHHIKPWKDYPELRFDVNNGITLCRRCHQLLHLSKEPEFGERLKLVIVRREKSKTNTNYGNPEPSPNRVNRILGSV